VGVKARSGIMGWVGSWSGSEGPLSVKLKAGVEPVYEHSFWLGAPFSKPAGVGWGQSGCGRGVLQEEVREGTQGLLLIGLQHCSGRSVW
jgi:hypothetical protein